MVVQKATNEPKLIILPDGSEVNLMPGAQISYPESFAKDNRKVELNGLAEFKVQHQTDRPFLVNAALMQVEVLGTQFSFYSSKDSAAVYLFEGRVAVRKEQGAADAIVIKPGMSAIYTKAYKEIVVDSTRAQGDYHANDPNRQFEFNSIPLGEAIQALEEVYKVNIKFDQSNIALCLLTAEFRNQTIEEILAVIAGTFQLRLEIKENTYTLYGEGC
jgi:ferric-dicitrate binding protein FerR (iron transport regulator)